MTTDPTHQDAARAAYERARTLAERLVAQAAGVPNSIETYREHGTDRYGVRLHVGTGLAAGRGVVQIATVADAEVTRDAGRDSSAWLEVRTVVDGVSLIARALVQDADAERLLTAGPAPATAPPAPVRPLAVLTAEENDVATCVGCGCTEDIPCPGGCYWVHTASMSDLCSACASPQQLAAAA
ncbi:hypothetical protein AB0M23_12990, partial [Streptomyces sp. NPDC052077]|uniref:hypothetical protein n=1 Tax=Streptomyces sp. NPDC052077 TaxID=3154757 RepID=UPI0034385C00